MATEEQLQTSKQKTFTNWKAQVLSFPLREAMLGILNPGVVCGFDTLHIYPDNALYKLGLSHERTGIKKTIYQSAEEGGGTGLSAPTGVLVSGFGSIIHSEEEVGVQVAGNAPLPTKDGYYMIYALYNRTQGIGTEPYNQVNYYLNPNMIKPIGDWKDTITEEDLVGPNKLSETMIPVSILMILQGKYWLLSEIAPEGDWGYEYPNNDICLGKLTSLDMITCFGAFGVGRFKYLGRTLDSIIRYINIFLEEKDKNRDQWNEMLKKLNMSSGNPEGPYNRVPVDNRGVPEKYIKERDEYGRPIYNDPTFIKEIYSVWLDLLILDQECTELWEKIGYPEEQPESEKVLLIANTVWENMQALEKHSDKLSDDIWARLGLKPNDGSEIYKNIIDKASTVWKNLTTLVDKLLELDNYVKEDKKGPDFNIKAIWKTLGYNVDANNGSYKGLLQTKSVWDNLKYLVDWVDNDVKSSNELFIRHEQARGKGVPSPLRICSEPWLLAYIGREPTLQEKKDYRNTFVWEVTNVEDLSNVDSTKEYELNIDAPYQSIPGLEEPNQRVGFIIWRPDLPGKKLFLKGEIETQKVPANSDLFMNNGGMAMIYKLTRDDKKWKVQIINPGTTDEPEVEDVQGLLPGVKVYGGTMVTTGIPQSAQGQVNYLKTVNPMNTYLTLDTSVGMHCLLYNSLAGVLIDGNSNFKFRAWGSECTIPLNIPRPTKAGIEIIIKVTGHADILSRISSSIGSNPISPDPVTYPDKSVGIHGFSGMAQPYGTTLIGLNFSLPANVILTELQDYEIQPIYKEYREFSGSDGKKGLVTNSYNDSSFLKWPGDWVRLRAIINKSGDLVWKIIENFRNPNVFLLIAQARIATGSGHLIYRLNECFPEYIKSNPDAGDMPYVGHRSSSGTKNALNTYLAITSRNHLKYQQFEMYKSKKGYGYLFSNSLPFPYLPEVGETRPDLDIDSERGNKFYWSTNPEQEPYGQLAVRNSMEPSGDGDDENYNTDAGWDFPLGGPLAAFRNYVYHNLILTED